MIPVHPTAHPNRFWVKTLNDLTTDQAMDLLRGHDIKHLEFAEVVDMDLACFAGNFGVTFEGKHPSDGRMLKPCFNRSNVRTLIVGGRHGH